MQARSHPFEGIINNFERRYRETESSTVREELAKYLNYCTCPDCEGTRLRAEARHVLVGGKALFEISRLPLKQTYDFFATLEFDGQKQAIAERIIKEIAARLRFLNNVGLDYLSLDRSADTLVRW